MTVRLELGGIAFEWDLKKASANKLKHGVDFDEAATTFLDPRSQSRQDDLHSVSEERWTLIGMSKFGRPVDLVVHLPGPVAQDHRLQDRESAGIP